MGKKSIARSEGEPDGRCSYLVLIVSNQGAIGLKSDSKSLKSDQKRLADFKTKVAYVLDQLALPVSIYAATTRDHYRKPRTGMWKELVEDCDLDAQGGPDLKSSIFVGDAAGRLARDVKTKADHASSDR
jgi:bifunctional polynucleotide phosphatase/kinase